MPLESPTYLDGLVPSNPASSDAVGQADDHIRLLKSVLKNTFPNINAACNATPLQLNQGFVPIGVIAMWSGDTSALPTNWKLCDGGTYAKSDGSGNITVPDLRSKFILGAGGSNVVPNAVPTVGTTGGAASVTPTITVAGTALTQANLPSLNWPVTDPGHTHTTTVTDPGHSHLTALVSNTSIAYGIGTDLIASIAGGSLSTYYPTKTNSVTTGITVANATATTGITVASGGSGTTHTHTATADALDNRPPFYTLAFIIKI